jgi:hypothetical protein
VSRATRSATWASAVASAPRRTRSPATAARPRRSRARARDRATAESHRECAIRCSRCRARAPGLPARSTAARTSSRCLRPAARRGARGGSEECRCTALRTPRVPAPIRSARVRDRARSCSCTRHISSCDRTAASPRPRRGRALRSRVRKVRHPRHVPGRMLERGGVGALRPQIGPLCATERMSSRSDSHAGGATDGTGGTLRIRDTHQVHVADRGGTPRRRCVQMDDVRSIPGDSLLEPLAEPPSPGPEQLGRVRRGGRRRGGVTASEDRPRTDIRR